VAQVRGQRRTGVAQKARRRGGGAAQGAGSAEGYTAQGAAAHRPQARGARVGARGLGAPPCFGAGREDPSRRTGGAPRHA
jgi:hypothetical protein